MQCSQSEYHKSNIESYLQLNNLLNTNQQKGYLASPYDSDDYDDEIEEVSYEDYFDDEDQDYGYSNQYDDDDYESPDSDYDED